jgi:hypothetical protein
MTAAFVFASVFASVFGRQTTLAMAPVIVSACQKPQRAM